MKKSNYIFRGKRVSVQEHFTGEFEIIDSNSGQILFLVANLERALEEYDRLNSSENESESENENLVATEELCFDIWRTSGDKLVELVAKFSSLELAKDFVNYQDTLGNNFVVVDENGFMVYGFMIV